MCFVCAFIISIVINIYSYLLYTALSAATQFNTKPNNNNYFRPKVSHYNQNLWLKRFGRDLNRAKDRYNSTFLHDTTERDSLTEGTSVEQRHRPKRQSAGRVTLCQSTSQYITPQAALNSKGKKLKPPSSALGDNYHFWIFQAIGCMS